MNKRYIHHFLTYAAIGIALFIFFLPIYWVVTTSFKSEMDTFAVPPRWIFKPVLEHWQTLFLDRGFYQFLFNSIVICSSATILGLIVGSLAAYSLSRFRISGSKHIAFWILSTRIIPPVTVAIPLYILMTQIHLTDTFRGMILVYTAINLPLSVWVMRGFFSELPVEFEEAALVDGCSRMGALIRIVFPLAAPGLAATAIFCFLFNWNEYLFALLLTSLERRTLPVATATFQTEREILWGQFTAAATTCMVPVLIIAAVVRKHLVRGLTLGVLKG
jgi:multiple sugar transport system permease protein